MSAGPSEQDFSAFLTGGGAMGDRIRGFDWSATALGPIRDWPPSLRSALSICLSSNFPIAIYWGSDLTLLYNDSWSPIPGEKHPWALGRPAREAWSDIWAIIDPLFREVVTKGVAIRQRDQLLPMHRRGFTEECYFDYTFSPIRDEGGRVQGVFNAVLETTTRVIGERRLTLLRELADWQSDGESTDGDACATAARVLGRDPEDLPFALVYLLSADGKATLAGRTMREEGPACPAVIDLEDPQCVWPFREVVATGRGVEVGDIAERFGPLGGVWPEPVRRAVVLPLLMPGQAGPAGFVVAGISPRLPLDDDYRGFLDLAAGHVAAAVAGARAYEAERRRAEQLAELDRAKTAFFSNVSHEFRTPLTLMLGPIEDLLAGGGDAVSPDARSQLELVNRNGLRLLRLVNSLLDFSRIEAGRVRATYRPTDLAAFTAELASVFRAAVERAGLRLVVDCAPLGEPVHVDREMWEKVVLNLLSNAFKFTLAGEIAVSLGRAGDRAELRVRDSGVGIPAEEMPRLFERFHRVENVRGRTHEGSGIGLALVQELVRLHGGEVSAESRVGAGTTFAVSLPFGTSHLPDGQVGSEGEERDTAAAMPFVEEALRWLPDSVGSTPGVRTAEISVDEPDPVDAGPAAGAKARVLVADDNRDMRQYVVRLLADRYDVEGVGDGEEALKAVERRVPDLVLTDVMMPGLDGFALLGRLRSDPRTASVPVIMLSARAGEESRVEGMEAGADDYLVKPFSARELLARVGAHLQIARLRDEMNASLREGEERLRMALTAGRMVAWQWNLDDDSVVSSANAPEVFGLPAGTTFESIGEGFDVIHPDDVEAHRSLMLSAAASGESYVATFRAIRPVDGRVIWLEERGRPVTDGAGRTVRLVGVVMDVTERRQAQESLEREREWLGVTLASIGDAVIATDTGGRVVFLNGVAEDLTGWARDEATGRPLAEVFPIINEYSRRPVENPVDRALRENRIVGLANHTILIARDGTETPIDDSAAPIRGEGGEVVGVVLVFRDVTETKRSEREQDERHRLMTVRAEVAAALATPQSTEAMLDRCCRVLEAHLPLTAVRIWLYDEKDRALGRAAEAGQNASASPDADRTRVGPHGPDAEVPASRADGNARALANYPLSVENRLIGVLSLTFRESASETVFTDLARLADGIAQAIDRRRAEERLREETRITETLHRIGSLVAAELDLDALVQTVTDEATALSGAQFGAFFYNVLNERGESYTLYTISGVPREAFDRFPMPRNTAIFEPTFRGTGVMRFDDVTRDPRYGRSAPYHGMPAGHLPVRSYLAVPVTSRAGEVLGGLFLGHSEPGRFAERHERIVVGIAAQAAVAIDNARLYREAREQAERLKEADRRKDEFLAMLAHELRNPLAPIRTGLEAMKLVGDDPAMLDEIRTTMEGQTRQLVRLVDDLLDVSRITSGKVTLRRERVELAAVVRSALQASRPLMDEAGHELVVALPAEPLVVDGDPARLAQVLSNLLTNAARYTPDGGRVELTVGRADGNAVVTLKDDGIGIPADMLEAIFEIFTQVDRSLERSQGGLGIGLTLVRRLVEMHGGTVEARSAGKGRGSEFVVRLPLAPQPVAAAPPVDERPTSSGRRRILVVDDNRDAARMLAMVIKVIGHEVRTAHDGLEALDVAAEFRPAVVFMDLGMPRLNGYDAARRMRANPEHAGTVLVALTGWGQDEDKARTREAGFDHHLVKPVEPSVLKKLLSDVVASEPQAD